MESYLLLILLAGFVAMDTTGGPQMLISEPLITCSIVGLIFGMPRAGLMIGMLFQLLWFGYMPLGAVRIPDTNMGALIAVASLLASIDIFGLSGDSVATAVIPAVVWGAVAGKIGSRMQAVVRRRNSRYSERITESLERGESVSIFKWHLLGLGSSFFRGVAMTVVLVPPGLVICGAVLLLPPVIIEGTTASIHLLWGTACASAVIISVLKGRVKPLIFGAACGAIWLLTLTGPAV